MNYTSFIIKILKEPEQNFLQNNIVVTKMLVKFVSPRTKTFNTEDTFQISIWENLSYETIKYYQPNDYIIIEGYISLRPNFSSLNKISKNDQQVEISVFKHYPFLLI
uniref:Single-stranded DNA-binding protein n=1 Tax=Actinocyclus sp. (in: diatoms) TaxID=1923973 RepID=A0A9E9BMR1_9STRA|nr:hypothetical protein [Actinocyclus sp. (in: diatoms)]